MKTSKKSAKVSKIQAQKVGIEVNPGVDPAVVAAYEAQQAHKAEVTIFDAGGNCPMIIEEKTVETQVVTVNQERFNRAGMDALMLAGLGEIGAVTVAPEKKTVRARINDGFLGLTRRMYRKGCNGQEILVANRDARLAAGYDEAKAMARAKKDYGYIVREAKAEKAAAAKTAHVEVDAPVAVAV